MLEFPTIILPLTSVTKLHKVLRDEEKPDPKRNKAHQQPVQQNEDGPAEHIDEMV